MIQRKVRVWLYLQWILALTDEAEHWVNTIIKEGNRLLNTNQGHGIKQSRSTTPLNRSTEGY
jgi:hypothetical protein